MIKNNTLKVCNRCKIEQPSYEFRSERSKICYDCHKQKQIDWRLSIKPKEKLCQKCNRNLDSSQFKPYHKWCIECSEKLGCSMPAKMTADEKMQERVEVKVSNSNNEYTAKLGRFKYKNHFFVDAYSPALFLGDIEENAVRTKISSVQQQIAKYQPPHRASLQQDGDYWIWDN